MGSFFFALFGIIWLCIVLGNENKSKNRYHAKVDEMKSRSKKWYARVNKGPLNNYQFHEKFWNDREFRKSLQDECNAIIASIPAMGDIRLLDPLGDHAETLMEMMFNARTGDVSFMWFSGYIRQYELTRCFSRKPSDEGCQALMRWYQAELRRNGYPEATVLPIHRSGAVVGWRFTDGATSYELIKREMFID